MVELTGVPLEWGAHLLLVNEVQVEVRAEEARVRVLLHEPKDALLCQVEAAPSYTLQVVLGVFSSVRVQIHLELVRATCEGDPACPHLPSTLAHLLDPGSILKQSWVVTDLGLGQLLWCRENDEAGLNVGRDAARTLLVSSHEMQKPSKVMP